MSSPNNVPSVFAMSLVFMAMLFAFCVSAAAQEYTGREKLRARPNLQSPRSASHRIDKCPDAPAERRGQRFGWWLMQQPERPLVL